MLSFRTAITALFALATFSPLAAAHSWVEEYQVISDNGSYTGARGYSRGFVSRADPTYNGFSMMWMLPSLEARIPDGSVRSRINASDLVCHPAQRTSNYTADFPKLKVAPGDYVAAKYLENGHVTLPWNITGKPAGSGTIFIFGTTQPSDTEKISDVMEWNTAGTGGNGKGFLLTAQNFDDGRCHQLNCGSISEQRQMLTPNHVAGQPTSTVESWCETDIKIPTNLTTGTLTTYWVWQWPTEPNADCNTPAGKDEYYTTCADFDIVDKAEMNKIAATPVQSAAGAESNPQSVAVSDYKSRTAYTPAPSVVMQNNNKIVGSLGTVNSAFVSACSAQAPVLSQYSLGIWPEVYVPNSCSVVNTFGTAAASAAAKAFDSAAASYTSGSKSAWSAAFAAAKVPLPTKSPWSQAPNTEAAQPTAAADRGSPSTTPAAAPTAYSGSSSAAAPAAPSPYVTTLTIVTTIVPGSSSASAQASTPVASPSSYAAPSSSSTIAPSYSAPSSVSAPSPTTYGAQSGAAGAIPTISTVGNGSPSASGSAYAPSVGANGTVYRRNHARNFVRS